MSYLTYLSAGCNKCDRPNRLYDPNKMYCLEEAITLNKKNIFFRCFNCKDVIYTLDNHTKNQKIQFKIYCQEFEFLFFTHSTLFFRHSNSFDNPDFMIKTTIDVGQYIYNIDVGKYFYNNIIFKTHLDSFNELSDYIRNINERCNKIRKLMVLK